MTNTRRRGRTRQAARKATAGSISGKQRRRHGTHSLCDEGGGRKTGKNCKAVRRHATAGRTVGAVRCGRQAARTTTAGSITAAPSSSTGGVHMHERLGQRKGEAQSFVACAEAWAGLGWRPLGRNYRHSRGRPRTGTGTSTRGGTDEPAERMRGRRPSTSVFQGWARRQTAATDNKQRRRVDRDVGGVQGSLMRRER